MNKLEKACAEKDFNQMLNICKDTNMNYMGLFLSNILLRQRNKPINDDLSKMYTLFNNRLDRNITFQFHTNNVELLEELSKLNAIQLSEIRLDKKSILRVNEVEYVITPDMITFSYELKIKLLCNWCSSQELANEWNKMTKGNYTWNNLRVVWNETPDYYVVLNSPPENEYFVHSKTILFQMEPNMETPHENYLYVFNHKTDLNNIEWHLGKTYTELLAQPIVKDENKSRVVSSILSDKYFDIGHQKRIDFVKYAEKTISFDIFGGNLFNFKSFQGSLPAKCKENGLFPYKYTLNAENNSIPNYISEKLIDAILSETLCFYWGCPNVSEHIDSRAYIQLPLDDFDKCIEIIQSSIKNCEWERRIQFIRNEKHRILNELQFFPRLEKFLKKIEIII